MHVEFRHSTRNLFNDLTLLLLPAFAICRIQCEAGKNKFARFGCPRWKACPSVTCTSRERTHSVSPQNAVVRPRWCDKWRRMWRLGPPPNTPCPKWWKVEDRATNSYVECMRKDGRKEIWKCLCKKIMNLLFGLM